MVPPHRHPPEHLRSPGTRPVAMDIPRRRLGCAAQATTTPATGQATKAGLPRRIPKANLVPGSAGRTDAETRPPARSADAARTRMAGFQRATRDGRTAAPQDRGPQHRWFLQVRPHPHQDEETSTNRQPEERP
jgi:hypothetical protein